jgi:hypothetical protein
MIRRVGQAFFLASIAVVGACGDDPNTTPTSPSFSHGSTTCDFSSLRNALKAYLSTSGNPNLEKTALDLLTKMQSSRNSGKIDQADNFGFSILAQIAAAADDPTKVDNPLSGPPTAPTRGEEAANHTLFCMSSAVTDGVTLPVTTFASALNGVPKGEFEVRGGSSTAPVRARNGSYSVLGLVDGKNWGQAFGGRLAGQTLIWGFPNTTSTAGGETETGTAYNWFTIPKRETLATFPSVIVALCKAPGLNDLVEETPAGGNPTVLRPVEASIVNALLDAGETCSTQLTSAGALERTLEFARRLILPTLARAAVFNPGGTGGLARGYSTFGPVDVLELHVSFIPDPGVIDPASKNSTLTSNGDSIRVLVTGKNDTPIDADVIVSFIKNAGEPAFLNGDTNVATETDGIAAFGDLSLTKTGGYRLVATVSVLNLTAADTSQAFNVSP